MAIPWQDWLIVYFQWPLLCAVGGWHPFGHNPISSGWPGKNSSALNPGLAVRRLNYNIQGTDFVPRTVRCVKVWRTTQDRSK
jgi:hypothetical protein